MSPQRPCCSLHVQLYVSWPTSLIASHTCYMCRTTNMNVLEIYRALRSALGPSSTQRISMKDIMYICGEIFTTRSCGLTDDWFLLPAQLSTVRRSPRRNRSVLAPSEGVISYAQVRDGIPNRWPASLKFARHNLMWMRLNNLPCVILSLDFSKEDSSHSSADPAILVFPICTSMLRRAQSVPANSLTSIDGETMALGNVDRRTVDFALAMKDFADMELAMYPQCKWYVYPTFIMNLLASQNEFRTWRNKVERSSRGRSGHDNRKIYLDALLEQHEGLRGVDERCLEGGGYPWDDSIIVPAPPPPAPTPPTPNPTPVRPVVAPRVRSITSTGINISKRAVNDRAPSSLPAVKDAKRAIGKSVDSFSKATSSPDRLRAAEKTSVKSVKTIRERKEKVPLPPPPPLPPKPLIMSNLFWVDKIGLPCVFYDDPGKEKEDRFNVLPVSTVTRKYDTQVSVRDVKELTVTNLKNCNEERTRDLGEALLMLYQWQEGRNDVSLLDEESPADHMEGSSSGEVKDKKGKGYRHATMEEEEEAPSPFQWPDFVLDLLVHTWKVWSSAVERNMAKSGKQDVRVSAYFSKLKEQYIEMLRERVEEAASTDDDNVMRGGQCDDMEAPLRRGGKETSNRKSKKMSNLDARRSASVDPIDSGDGSTDLPTNEKPPARSSTRMSAPVSMSNLFWIPDLALPALFYDDEGAETNDSFFVFPFSASSARYYMMMKASSLRPLTVDNIADCLDTHTRCFGEALLKFCDWERDFKADSNKFSNGVTQQSPYVWPDFILDLVAHRSKWTSWRRETERGWKKFHLGSSAQSSALRELYFDTLRKEYCELNDLPLPPPPPPPEPKVSASAQKPQAKPTVASSSGSDTLPIKHVLLGNIDINLQTAGTAEGKDTEFSERYNGSAMNRPRSESDSSSQSSGIVSMSCSDSDVYYPDDDIHRFYNPPGSAAATDDPSISDAEEVGTDARDSAGDVSDCDGGVSCDGRSKGRAEVTLAALPRSQQLLQTHSPGGSLIKKRPFFGTWSGDDDVDLSEDGYEAPLDEERELDEDACKRARYEDAVDMI